jgi:hypothetical protein
MKKKKRKRKPCYENEKLRQEYRQACHQHENRMKNLMKKKRRMREQKRRRSEKSKRKEKM